MLANKIEISYISYKNLKNYIYLQNKIKNDIRICSNFRETICYKIG